MRIDAKGPRGIDRIFGDVALDPLVIADPGPLLCQPAALILHLAGELPGTADHLGDTAHPLAVGAEHGNGTHVVQHILGSDRLRPYAAFGERHILRHRGIQMMTHHDHVEVLIEGIHRIGICRIGRRRQAVRLAGDADDVRGMASAGAFRVIHVDGAAVDCG